MRLSDQRPIFRIFGWLAILSVAVAITGCCPSVEKLIAMRSELEVKPSAKNFKKIKKYFADPRGGSWRAEAMTTMACLTNYLSDPKPTADGDSAEDIKEALSDLKEDGFPSADQRQSDLILILRNEYSNPKIKRKDSTPRYRLSGWAIYTLGVIPDENLVSYYADVLLDHATDARNEFYIASAAMSSLSRHTSVLEKNDLLRRRALEGVAATQSAIKKASRSSLSVQRIKPIMNYLENQIKDYKSVVLLLPPDAKNDIPPRVMTEILLWNYQKLKTDSHKAPGSEKTFRENIRRLLILAWNNDKEVRTRSRVILEEFAPLPLFDALAAKMRNMPSSEDCRHISALLATADKAAGSNNTDYISTRTSAFKGLFSSLRRIPARDREVIYARLIETDPAMLGEKLLQVNARVKTEDTEKMLQQVRYLVKLRDKSRLGKSAATDTKLRQAIAEFMAPKSFAVRQQVVAALMDDDPLLLAMATGKELTRFASQASRDADYLSDTYMGCLEKLQGNGATAQTSQVFQKTFKRSPDELLSGAMAREELDIRRKVSFYLEKRNITLLVTLLAQNTNPSNYEHLVMLGDIFQLHLKEIPAGLNKDVMNIFSKAVNSRNEEIALLSARYYLECGGQLGAARLSSLSPAVRALAELKDRVDATIARANKGNISKVEVKR